MAFMIEHWHELIHWLSVNALMPALTWMHIQYKADDVDDISQSLLIACVQVAIITCILRPLETFAPAEKWTDRRFTHVDRKNTLLDLFGLTPLFAFLVLTPFANVLGVSDTATDTNNVHGVLQWIPGIEQHPYIAFALYYVVYDLVYYWMHRLEHALPWWWALHSMHHSQRQMNCWTSDRSHFLDSGLESIVFAGTGLIMGVDASQFALLVLLSELMQNLSHTNTRFGFGRYLDKLLVDPRFHRLHHMRADHARPNLHNCNFGQVLSVWDRVFGTALYGEPLRPTGLDDPTADADNGRGLIAMQWYTLHRFWHAFRQPAGWKMTDVSFGNDYIPVPGKP